MATSKEAKDAPAVNKEAEDKDNPKNQPSNESSSTTNVIDGRIFEADSEVALSAEESAEQKEFDTTLKKYNDLARKMRKEALRKEQGELKQVEKSPKLRYYEGTRAERIKILETETKLMEEMEKKLGEL